MDKILIERIKEISQDNHSNNTKAVEILKISELCIQYKPKREIIHNLLDAAHLNHISILIANSPYLEQWLNNLTVLIKLSN